MGNIVFALLMLVVGLIVWYFARNVARQARTENERRVWKIGAGVALVAGIGLFLIILVANSWVEVQPGFVGVQRLLGKVDPEPLLPGPHVVNPLVNVEMMETRIKASKAAPHEAASLDTQKVTVTFGLNYFLQPEHAPWVYEHVGTGWEVTIIPNAEQECLKAEVSKYKAADLLKFREKVSGDVKSALSAWLGRYYITLSETSVQNIDFSTEYDKAIEAKQKEEQQALQKTYELQAADTGAQIAKSIATGKADAAIEDARGQAASMKAVADAKAYQITAEAKAQADANKLLTESLSGPGAQNVISMVTLKTWDGKLPTTILGDKGSILLNLLTGK